MTRRLPWLSFSFGNRFRPLMPASSLPYSLIANDVPEDWRRIGHATLRFSRGPGRICTGEQTVPTGGQSMCKQAPEQVRDIVEQVYRSESRRVYATLVRLIGDLDLAEESLHEAFAAAIERWSQDGVPAQPRAWLVSTGRFKAIDALRRRRRFDSSVQEIARLDQLSRSQTQGEVEDIEDDRLRLIFTCCHPALAHNTQVALTLREVCGLTTEEIAGAFLTAPATMAQRIVRGKAKIRDARIPYVVPSLADLPDRLDSVLSVIYLVFKEGYSASSGASVTRCDLSEEAIRLGRLLAQLLPDSEVIGLLSLMLLHESRREARTSPTGDLILLEDQDRSLWNRDRSPRGSPSSSAPSARRTSAPTRSRPRSPPSMPRRRRPRRPTGRGSSRSTTCSSGRLLRPWWSSTARWRWRCATARSRGLRGSTRSWAAATSWITTSLTPHVPTCAGVSAGWLKRASRTCMPWPWHARSPSAGTSRNGSSSWAKKNPRPMSKWTVWRSIKG